MQETLKADNLQKAIRLLPPPKTYIPNVITVLVGKIKFTFEKIEKEWYFKF
jgi:hypothetical protein